MKHALLLVTLALVATAVVHADAPNGTSQPMSDAAIEAKTRAIVLTVNFSGVSVEAAVEALNGMAKEADPAKTGVKIVYHAPPPGSPLVGRTVSMSLNAVPLSEVLHYLTQMTGFRSTIKNGEIDVE
jgi:hypothetical protein